MKDEIASRVRIDASNLPYNPELIGLLRSVRRTGRRLWLVTAADRQVAEAVAARVGL